jgi:hypothetical protein
MIEMVIFIHLYFLDELYTRYYFVNDQDPGGDDAGAYKCHVENKYGELNANLNLNIEGDE